MSSELATVQSDLAKADSEVFALVQRKAQLLAASTIVPATFTGNVANCVVAMNMAERIGADVLSVMQSLYIVHGKPGWSSAFLIACVNTSGTWSAIDYEFSGTVGKDTWGCTALATELSTGEVKRGTTITIALAKAEGWYGKKDSKWRTMPEQMLRYRAAAFWVRVYCPEIALGMRTADEIVDMATASQAVATPEPAPSEVVEATVLPDKPPGAKPKRKRRTKQQIADDWQQKCEDTFAKCTTPDELDKAADTLEAIAKSETQSATVVEVYNEAWSKLTTVDENQVPNEVVPDGELFATHQNGTEL